MRGGWRHHARRATAACASTARRWRALAPGQPVLKPRLVLIGAEHAERGASATPRTSGLELWLAQTVATDLRPLMALETAWREGRLPPDARGLAFRLIENAGALDRAQRRSSTLMRASAGRAAALRRAHRAARRSSCRSWCARARRRRWPCFGISPSRARRSRVFARGPARSLCRSIGRAAWGECAAAGYRACGRVAVRLDLVERLAEAIEQTAPISLNPRSRASSAGPRANLAACCMALGYQQGAGDGRRAAAMAARFPPPQAQGAAGASGQRLRRTRQPAAAIRSAATPAAEQTPHERASAPARRCLAVCVRASPRRAPRRRG